MKVAICALLGACALSALTPATALGRAPATFFTDPNAFHNQMQAQGKAIKGIEDFEYANVQQGSKTPFPNPLMAGVPRPGFPTGLLSPNLIIQTNITPGPCPPVPNPSGNPNALWVNGANFIGSNSIKVGTDEFLSGLDSSIDLLFTTHDKTGVAVDASTFAGFNAGHAGFVFCAYDQFNNVLGSFTLPGPTATEPAKSFVGVWSNTPIARLNIYGIFTQPQPFAVDNIEMWAVPAPASAGVLGLAGLAALRRRR